MRNHPIKFAMLSTGEEILQGDIDDTNASWLARRFFDSGFMLARRVTVGDRLQDIVDELQLCSKVSNVVIVNGGLGPTSDDITVEAMALAMKEELVLNPAWLATMQAYFQRTGREMPKSNIKQAMLPQSAEMIPNEVGTACGFSAILNDCLFFFTPGVPKEFKHMIDNAILPRLFAEYGEENKKQLLRFYTFGLSESLLNDKLSPLTLPEDCALGYRSAMPFIEVKLFAPQKQTLEALARQIHSEIGEHLVGFNQSMLAKVGELLTENKHRFSVIEGFTAGTFASWISENEHLQKSLFQSVISKEHLQEQADFSSVLALANKIKASTSVDIGLACVQTPNNSIAIGMSTPQGEIAVEVAFIRKQTTKDRQMYISALMLDMLRRYEAHFELIPNLSGVNLLNTFSNMQH